VYVGYLQRSSYKELVWPWLAAVGIVLAACTSGATVESGTSVTSLGPSVASIKDLAPSPTFTPTPGATSQVFANPTEAPNPQRQTPTQTPSSLDDPTQLMVATLTMDLAILAEKMAISGNQSFIPVLLEWMSLGAEPNPLLPLASFVNALKEGRYSAQLPRERSNWRWWFNWLGDNPQVQPPEGFAGWKGELYAGIDPGLGSFLYDGVKTEIRLEQMVWGGVAKDGIPELNNPPLLAAAEAGYLESTDRVFGVSINGEHRAYPLRILNPHEMANDVIGGVPISLAY